MSNEENVQVVKDFFAAIGGYNNHDLLALDAEDSVTTRPTIYTGSLPSTSLTIYSGHTMPTFWPANLWSDRNTHESEPPRSRSEVLRTFSKIASETAPSD